MIDLHTHTTASHGRRTPAEAMEEAARAGLEAVAVTDHNTIEGLDEAEAAATRLGVRLVPGVELSVDFEGWEIHMLGLFMDHHSEALRLEMDRFGGTLVAFLPQPIRRIAIDVPREARPMQALRARATVSGPDGPMAGTVPVELVLTDPQGRRSRSPRIRRRMDQGGERLGPGSRRDRLRNPRAAR